MLEGFAYWLTRSLYGLLMVCAQPLLRYKLHRRARHEPIYGQYIAERFGHYPHRLPSHDGPTVWVHAVSLGETRAAVILVRALRECIPQMRLLLTHGTATGRLEGEKLLTAGDLQVWQPWDTSCAVGRFLHHFKPDLGILIETEVWPNLTWGCQQQGVPLVLANARFSEKSMRRSQRLAWLARPAFAALAGVWAQTESDAQRLRAMGAPVRGVLGNIKFDALPDPSLLAQGQRWRAELNKPVVMFASSREGEEQLLLETLKEFSAVALLNNGHDAIQIDVHAVHWLIVPRHPQRFDAVAQLLTSQGYAVQRRSNWGANGPACTEPGQRIWLGDSVGEMPLYYGLADVALLGGSFAPLGGQNLIEAATCACPVVMGPHTFNFTQAADLALAAGAAQRASDIRQAVQMAVKLAADHASASQAALRFASAHQGAARQLATALSGLLESARL